LALRRSYQRVHALRAFRARHIHIQAHIAVFSSAYTYLCMKLLTSAPTTREVLPFMGAQHANFDLVLSGVRSQVGQVMKPLLQFWYHEDVRSSAIATMPSLVQSAKAYVAANAGTVDASVVKQVLSPTSGNTARNVSYMALTRNVFRIGTRFSQRTTARVIRRDPASVAPAPPSGGCTPGTPHGRRLS